MELAYIVAQLIKSTFYTQPNQELQSENSQFYKGFLFQNVILKVFVEYSIAARNLEIQK